MSSASTNQSTPSKAEGEEISLKKRFFNIQTFISFAIAFAIIIFLLTRLNMSDLTSIWERLKSSNPFLLALAFLAYYASFPLRGLRWRLLLNNVGFSRSQGVEMPSTWGLGEMILLSWFANCVVPARLGDAYRAYLLKKNAGVSFSTTIGTVLAERVIDMIILFVLLAVSGVGILRGSNTGIALKVLIAGFGMVLLLGLALLAMKRLGSRLQRLLPLKLRSAYQSFQDGTLGSFRQLPVVTFLSIGTWLLEAGRLLFVVWALGMSLSLPMILFVALAHSMLTVIPFTPGGLGLAEAGVVGLLMLTLPKESAISIAFLDRAIAYWSIVFFGFILFLFSRKK